MGISKPFSSKFQFASFNNFANVPKVSYCYVFHFIPVTLQHGKNPLKDRNDRCHALNVTWTKRSASF